MFLALALLLQTASAEEAPDAADGPEEAVSADVAPDSGPKSVAFDMIASAKRALAEGRR